MSKKVNNCYNCASLIYLKNGNAYCQNKHCELQKLWTDKECVNWKHRTNCRNCSHFNPRMCPMCVLVNPLTFRNSCSDYVKATKKFDMKDKEVFDG